MKTLISTAVLSIILTTGTGSAQAAMKEGRWTFTTKVFSDAMASATAEMEAAIKDLPPEQQAMMRQMMAGQTNPAAASGDTGISKTITQCVTNDQPIPQTSNDSGCEVQQSVNGDVIEFTSVCPYTTSQGQLQYTDETMEGEINSVTKTDDGETTVTIKITGTYEGPCEE